MTRATSRPSVIVVGAGLSGLCLAQALHRAGVEVQVFERDGAPSSRGQGYRLTIDPGGSRALQACLPPRLYRLVVATSGVPGRRFTVYNERREVLHQSEFPHAHDPAAPDTEVVKQIDRLTLRRILLGGLADRVHFGKPLSNDCGRRCRGHGALRRREPGRGGRAGGRRRGRLARPAEAAPARGRGRHGPARHLRAHPAHPRRRAAPARRRDRRRRPGRGPRPPRALLHQHPLPRAARSWPAWPRRSTSSRGTTT